MVNIIILLKCQKDFIWIDVLLRTQAEEVFLE